ncbi:MAG: alpha/beta hydrolase [Gemmatimonadales bacterium]|nr:alpha/beta hydrolase [Gemmatimonadales bacterium]
MIELGGRGPLVHLAPANGFPPATYLPALRPVLEAHRVVSLPPRAMWPDIGSPPETPGSWTDLADDLLAGLHRHALPPLVGIGHSFGAVVTLLAAVQEPTRFTGLVLLDPTILPLKHMDQIRERKARGEVSFRPLADGARKRRDRFENAEAAFTYWREKPLFADWSDDALTRYVDAMLRPTGQGDFTLTWSRDWEAYYYDSFYADTWNALDQLDSALPVLVVGGERSDTFVPEAARLMKERLPRATSRTVPGQGHLFPQAAPEETGMVIAEWLASSDVIARPRSGRSNL